jgi:hypothetical protein
LRTVEWYYKGFENETDVETTTTEDWSELAASTQETQCLLKQI